MSTPLPPPSTPESIIAIAHTTPTSVLEVAFKSIVSALVRCETSDMSTRRYSGRGRGGDRRGAHPLTDDDQRWRGERTSQVRSHTPGGQTPPISARQAKAAIRAVHIKPPAHPFSSCPRQRRPATGAALFGENISGRPASLIPLGPQSRFRDETV